MRLEEGADASGKPYMQFINLTDARKAKLSAAPHSINFKPTSGGAQAVVGAISRAWKVVADQEKKTADAQAERDELDSFTSMEDVTAAEEEEEQHIAQLYQQQAAALGAQVAACGQQLSSGDASKAGELGALAAKLSALPAEEAAAKAAAEKRFEELREKVSKKRVGDATSSNAAAAPKKPRRAPPKPLRGPAAAMAQAQAQKAMAQAQKAMQQRAVGGAAGAPAFAPPTPYPSFDDVDAAIKPLSAGVSLWVGDYPDTAEGNEALDGVLKQPAHAEKLARFAAMECDEADTARIRGGVAERHEGHGCGCVRSGPPSISLISESWGGHGRVRLAIAPRGADGLSPLISIFGRAPAPARPTTQRLVLSRLRYGRWEVSMFGSSLFYLLL